MATMSYVPYIPWDEMSSCSWHFPKFFLEDSFRPSKGCSKREKGVRIKSFRCINNRLLWSDPHYISTIKAESMNSHRDGPQEPQSTRYCFTHLGESVKRSLAQHCKVILPEQERTGTHRNSFPCFFCIAHDLYYSNPFSACGTK